MTHAYGESQNLSHYGYGFSHSGMSMAECREGAVKMKVAEVNVVVIQGRMECEELGTSYNCFKTNKVTLTLPAANPSTFLIAPPDSPLHWVNSEPQGRGWRWAFT